MKFTSEDLLNAMGLKVGDMIYNQSRNITYLVCVSDWSKGHYLKDDCNNSKDVWLVDIIGEEYTIIQPKPTLTEDEKVRLRNLDKKWKWIARSEWESNLALYTTKPSRSVPSHDEIHDEREWKVDKGSEYTEMREWNKLFKFIKWEDEPYSIEELLGDY